VHDTFGWTAVVTVVVAVVVNDAVSVTLCVVVAVVVCVVTSQFLKLPDKWSVMTSLNSEADSLQDPWEDVGSYMKP
jgi:hypothetical protein